jgi:hypothetical protein
MSEDGTRYAWIDVDYERKHEHYYLLFSLVLAMFIVGKMKHSGAWMLGSFATPLIINLVDRKFVPYGELESFYKYVDEKRKAQHVFKKNEEVAKSLQNYDSKIFEQVKGELEKTNKTIYDVVADLDELYLKAALKH